MFKVGDRVRNKGGYYPNLAKEGTVVSVAGDTFDVRFGGYGLLCCRSTDVELIKGEEKEMEIPKAYKGFRVVDGKMISLVHWGKDNRPEGVDYLPSELTYIEGQITYAPEGTQGIFFEPSLEHCQFVTTREHGQVIHEVIPLGKQGKGWDNMDVCPTILVGKEVWREKAEKLEPKFKVGDEVVIVKEQIVTGMYEGVGHKGTIKSVEWLEPIGRYTYTLTDSYATREDWAELAPKEEWVDVTKECELVWIEGCDSNHGYYVHLTHEGYIVACFGLGGWRDNKIVGYELRPATENYVGTLSTFKVFKKR